MHNTGGVSGQSPCKQLPAASGERVQLSKSPSSHCLFWLARSHRAISRHSNEKSDGAAEKLKKKTLINFFLIITQVWRASFFHPCFPTQVPSAWTTAWSSTRTWWNTPGRSWTTSSRTATALTSEWHDSSSSAAERGVCGALFILSSVNLHACLLTTPVAAGK